MTTLFTWRDVEAELVNGESPWIEGVTFPQVLTITLARAEDIDSARKELERRFGVSFFEDTIDLVPSNGAKRSLPVRFKIAAADDIQRLERLRRLPTRPLWSSRPPASGARPPAPSERIISVFYSYKGGVARTTVALAVLGELLRRQETTEPRVLLVDADVEAPGITWMLDRNERLSLLDAFGLIHDAEDWEREALPLIVEQLRSSRETIEIPDRGRREYYFLPAMRSIEQVFRMPLTPEHLVRGAGRAQIVGDFFTALARELQLEAVLIDTRAGITEFTSPLLLDDRTRAILVSSCNQQAVEGTVATLQHLKAFKRDLRADCVVLTLVPPDSFDVLVKATEERIFSAMESEEDVTNDDVVSDIERFPYAVPFAQELLHFNNITDLITTRIPGTQLGKQVAPALADLIVPPRETSLSLITASGPPTHGQVHDVAERFEFAENNISLGLLPIPALRSLVDQPGGRLPAAVVLGPKGAGKTFAWGQMVLSRTWDAFCRQIIGSEVSGRPTWEALVFPLLQPKNLHGELSARVQETEAAARGGRTAQFDALELATKIESVRQKDAVLQFWIDAILARLGLESTGIETVRALEQQLQRQDLRILLVIDGIEDALQLGPQERLSEPRRRILRLLLQDLTTSIRALNSEFLGIVTFVRVDYAIEALAQNFRQFESLHRQHALQWSPTEALRLPVWLCSKLGWELLPVSQIETATYSDLRRALIAFWGEKMGKNPREPYCDEWIIAALSDLNGRIQARDLVRLIRFATGQNQSGHEWPISARRLRDALKPCAELKVEELEKEIRNLKPILDKLRAIVPDRKAIPLIPRKLADSPRKRPSSDEVRFLEDQGLITKLDGDSDEYYMPEIIRQGLGYRLSGGRRAKVLSLYRAALARARG